MIENNYKDMNLNLNAIAADIGVSSAYLSKVFRSHEFMSVGDYIKEYRLLNAAKMLEENKYTVNKIMGMTGFGNQSYFYKLFKQKYGVTPKEYQQSKLLNNA
ncbi:helix-turn-helix transcriptional regulator [Bacillaceae bacterium SIJ1]|uniref:helix-turn-helix domain-containing protein n=1 Tax=Litoribacterium kuwaitense TaxID=1398745 RepID=UPI0013EC3650|nr:helix-turn-helix transcriptional regulator [Litoribacterium kuwaitense]NGP44900.1 helix-turn-helix transcriptional regulator [Litoribacterium kuwaitense]